MLWVYVWHIVSLDSPNEPQKYITHLSAGSLPKNATKVMKEMKRMMSTIVLNVLMMSVVVSKERSPGSLLAKYKYKQVRQTIKAAVCLGKKYSRKNIRPAARQS